MKLVNNPATGVMAGTLYMARQIEGNLALTLEQTAEPSVGLDAGTVDFSHVESTTQQITP